jgi:hypothetical protein
MARGPGVLVLFSILSFLFLSFWQTHELGTGPQNYGGLTLTPPPPLPRARGLRIAITRRGTGSGKLARLPDELVPPPTMSSQSGGDHVEVRSSVGSGERWRLIGLGLLPGAICTTRSASPCLDARAAHVA